MTDTNDLSRNRIRDTLVGIVDLFRTGDVPRAIAIVTFPPLDVPCNRWSLTNRLLVFMEGTSDARGWKQWKRAGRYVKKGEKAFYILAPKMIVKTRKEEDLEKESFAEEEKEYICTGFIPVPVFAAEQTEGEPLVYETHDLPSLPLYERANEWGIEVKAVTFQEKLYGYYQIKQGRESIRLATPDETTFFHELAHAAHRRVKGELEAGENAWEEIVAELSAQVLAHLVGTQVKSTLGNSYRYISHYAEKLNQDAFRACLLVLSEVEDVLALILENSQYSHSNLSEEKGR